VLDKSTRFDPPLKTTRLSEQLAGLRTRFRNSESLPRFSPSGSPEIQWGRQASDEGAASGERRFKEAPMTPCRGLSLSQPPLLVLVSIFQLLITFAFSQDLGQLGSYSKWSKVEIILPGPNAIGLNNFPNPFQIEVDVVFVDPAGRTYVVPAFYDGDGIGGMDGNIWKVRFSTDRTGFWRFVSLSSEPLLDNYQGTFDVVAPPANAQFFSKWGRLQYVGKHYLKFADGPYWIKGGADDPEDFLGPGVMGDWNGKKAAVDYLASKEVNSMYIMLQNVLGDGNNVWPWASQLDSEHFDVAKLADWEDLLTYIQSKGIVVHLVLEDDSGWSGFNRGMYYREMMARFAHHNGLIWNISEEYNENYTALEVKSFAQQIRDLDPYDHPVTVHNQGTLNNWAPFLGDDRFHMTSFQTVKAPQNAATITWRNDSVAQGRPLVISVDETGPISSSERDIARKIVWSVYMAGGNSELHSWPLTVLQDFEDHWNDMRRARSFLESLPFWDMEPENSLLVGGTGNRYCFRKTGDVYAIYLEEGSSISLDLTGQSGTFEVQWYDPRNGVFQIGGTVQGGGIVSLGALPFTGDVAAVVKLSGLNLAPAAPTNLRQIQD